MGEQKLIDKETAKTNTRYNNPKANKWNIIGMSEIRRKEETYTTTN